MILEDPARDRQLTVEQALDSGLVDALAPDLESALDEFAALVAARLDQNADERPASDDAWPGRPAPLPAADTPEAEELRDALDADRSEEHTSELQSRGHLVCRRLLE